MKTLTIKHNNCIQVIKSEKCDYSSLGKAIAHDISYNNYKSFNVK